MNVTVQINHRGNMTLPKKLRKKLGVDKGGIVIVEESNDGIILHPALSFPIEIYSEARVKEFDGADATLDEYLKSKQ